MGEPPRINPKRIVYHSCGRLVFWRDRWSVYKDRVKNTGLRVDFAHRHVRDTVIIMEKGNLTHLRCPWCDIMVLWEALNVYHLNTTKCAKGAKRKRPGLAVEEARVGTEAAFQEYGLPITNVVAFK